MSDVVTSGFVASGSRRPERGLVTRPSVTEVGEYRAHVDQAVAELLADDLAAEQGEAGFDEAEFLTDPNGDVALVLARRR